MEKVLDHIKVGVERGIPVCTIVYRSPRSEERLYNVPFNHLVSKLLEDDTFRPHLSKHPGKSMYRKNQARPYIAKFNPVNSTYIIRSNTTGTTKSALFYYPEPKTATVENVLNYNMQLAKQRNIPMDRYEKALRDRVHVRLQRVLGENYEAAYSRPKEGRDQADGPFYHNPASSRQCEEPFSSPQAPVRLEDLDIPYFNTK